MAIPVPADLYSDSGLHEKEKYQVSDSSSNKDASASKDADVPVQHVQEHNDDSSSDQSVKEVFTVEAIDPVLQRKMALVNGAIDEIGMTGFQWKMFWLNGFGYAVDSVSRRRLP
jgi:hypothetical protein